VRLCDAGCCRVVHSESDFLPGLIVDKYDATLVLQTLSLGLERFKAPIADALMALTGARGVYERNDTPVRDLEGLPRIAGPLLGQPDPAPIITENGIRLRIDVAAGQKTGYFLDQKENRAALAPLVPGARVLDCFCHAGSFALHAAAYGAAEAAGVDISEQAVALARENAELNGLSGLVAFECRNAFDRLRELHAAGEKYDVVILDPPAFAKSKAALPGATRGYKEINLQALRMIRDGGFLVTCSCSHHMLPPLFTAMVLDAAADARRTVRLVEARTQAKDHPILPAAPETQYLKCLILQVFS
jgi:23S rRNA (cytosine1962-C5)-methyltransferase